MSGLVFNWCGQKANIIDNTKKYGKRIEHKYPTRYSITKDW